MYYLSRLLISFLLLSLLTGAVSPGNPLGTPRSPVHEMPPPERFPLSNGLAGGCVPGNTASGEQIPLGKKEGMSPPTAPLPPPSDGKPHLYTPPQKKGLSSHILFPEGGNPTPQAIHLHPTCPATDEGYTVNFQDISVIQLIQFISRISGTNFIFDNRDLQFNITVISEDPTSVADLSAALMQILRIHGLSIVEEGNNVLIYRTSQPQGMSKVSTVITDDNVNVSCDAAVITRVFRLYNVDPNKIGALIKPLLSADSIVEVSEATRHLIVSDITTNVSRIADLLQALDNPSKALEVGSYAVRSSDPGALVTYAREILGPLAQDNPIHIIPQPAQRKIYVVSTSYLVEKTLQILESLDSADIVQAFDLPSTDMVNNNFYMYKLKYQNGQEIANALEEIGNNLQYMGVANPDFVNTIQSIQWIQVNNSIVIAGTQESINKVLDLLLELDLPPKQVYIEVLIIDTSLANSLDFGVQWIALGDEQNKLAYASGLLGNTPPNPNLAGGSAVPGARFIAANPASNPPLIPNPGRDIPMTYPNEMAGVTSISNDTVAFGLGIIGNIIRHNGKSFLTLGALLSALDEEADTTIVLNPKIMVEDTQSAVFFVGQNIPYETTSTVIQQTGSVTQNIQYEDVGVELRVTPTIAPDNMVTLQIDQSIADVYDTGVNGVIPSINKTLTTTRVHVPDGAFLVMSGHIRDQETYIHSGIPCLGSLPLIGPMFSRTVDQRTKRNLIMFLRAKVVTTVQEGVDLTNQEGYDYNWEANPCSILECGTERAPECETYPPPCCPTN